jgi:hypothetical protein
MGMRTLASRPRTSVRDSAPLLGLLLVLAACGPSTTATSSLGTAATVTAGSTASATPVASPLATVPAGFPIKSGSEAVEPLPDEPRLVARWTSDANGAQVYDFFVEALPAAGFQIDQLAPGGDAAIITFSAPGGAQFSVSLTAEGAGTRIDLRLPDDASG